MWMNGGIILFGDFVEFVMMFWRISDPCGSEENLRGFELGFLGGDVGDLREVGVFLVLEWACGQAHMNLGKFLILSLKMAGVW